MYAGGHPMETKYIERQLWLRRHVASNQLHVSWFRVSAFLCSPLPPPPHCNPTYCPPHCPFLMSAFTPREHLRPFGGFQSAPLGGGGPLYVLIVIAFPLKISVPIKTCEFITQANSVSSVMLRRLISY